MTDLFCNPTVRAEMDFVLGLGGRTVSTFRVAGSLVRLLVEPVVDAMLITVEVVTAAYDARAADA